MSCSANRGPRTGGIPRPAASAFAFAVRYAGFLHRYVRCRNSGARSGGSTIIRVSRTRSEPRPIGGANQPCHPAPTS
jgi:hypothetical protein